MSTGLIDIMKRASLNAVETSQPTDLKFGTVVDTSPLKVKVSNLLTLPASFLIVPKHLTNYKVTITIDDENKTITVHNALKNGDKVALLRKSGGQSFFILDKI